MPKTRKFFPAGISLIILGVSIASAHGRKPDYEDRAVYVPPARRGSAANPNSAFSPPKFNDPFSRPAAAPAPGATPPTYNYGYDKTTTGSHAAAAPKSAPATPAASTVLPSNTDGLQAPAPRPTSAAPMAPADQGVPTLPGFDAPTSGAGNTDGLQTPSVHPTPAASTTTATN